MRVIVPTAITAAMVTSSTAAEPSGADPTVYSAVTAYTAGQFCYLASTHRVYKNLVASTGVSPDTDATKWLDYSATNKFKMFDSEVGTSTTATTTLTAVISTGANVNSIALMELVGTTASVTVKSTAGGTTVYTNSISLDGTILIDWYMYFFDPYAFLTQWVLTDLPAYLAAEITVTISGTGTVSCGVCSLGQVYYLGDARYGASVGIVDYSSKAYDSAYGRTVITKRAYSRKMDLSMLIDSTTFNKVATLLSTSLRSTPAVWIGTDSTTYAPMIIFGYYKDWSITVQYPTAAVANLSIEGLT